MQELQTFTAHPAEHDQHQHHRHPERPVISQKWKWATVLGNAAIGAAELATGNMSTLSVTADGIHNVGDTATYYMQAENVLNPNQAEHRKARLRKLSHYIIATSSLGVSVKAGVDLAWGHEGAQHAFTTYAAGASLLLNGLLLTRLRQGIKRRKHSPNSPYEQDLSKHFWAVDIPSAALAVTGAVLQKYNVGVEQMAAIVSGVVGAYAFRPTKANLTHNCLGHAHHDDAIIVPRHRFIKGESAEWFDQKGWLHRVTYRPRRAA